MFSAWHVKSEQKATDHDVQSLRSPNPFLKSGYLHIAQVWQIFVVSHACVHAQK